MPKQSVPPRPRHDPGPPNPEAMEIVADVARSGPQSAVYTRWGAYFEEAVRSHYLLFLSAYWAALELDQVAPLSQTDLEMAYFGCYGPPVRAIVGHRGKGKTTAVTGPIVTYHLLRDPRFRFTLIGSKESEAIQTGTAIRAQWEDPRLFFVNHLVPPDGFPDNARNFSCAGGDPSLRQPSVACRGFGSSIQGGRANGILLDDIEGIKNTETHNARMANERGVKQAKMLLYPSYAWDRGRQIDPNFVLGVGTFKCDDSVYAKPVFGTCRSYPLRHPSESERTPYIDPIIIRAVDEDPSLIGTPVDPIRFTEANIIETFGDMARAGSTDPEYLREFQCVLRANAEDRFPLKLKDFIVDTIDRESAPRSTVWGEKTNARDTVIIDDPDCPCLGFPGDKLLAPIWRDDQSRIPYEGRILCIDPGGKGDDEFSFCIMLWAAGYLFVPVLKGLHSQSYRDLLDTAVAAGRDWKVHRIFYEKNQDGTGLLHETLQARILLQKQAPSSIHPEGWCPHPEGIAVQSWSTKRKNLRIITALRGPLSTHRLIIAKEALYDPTVEKPYQLQVQIASMDSDPTFEMKQDDRADVLAFAIACADQHGVIGLDPETRRDLQKGQERDEFGDLKIPRPNFFEPPAPSRRRHRASRGNFLGLA